MKTKTPKFDQRGYQTNLRSLSGEPPPDQRTLRRLTPAEQSALGLPSPEQLAGKAPVTKITLAVDDDALAFFKNEADRLGTSYQRMMRNLLTSYAAGRRSD